MARIDSFLRLVAEQQASDLHFHGGNVPIIRHDGDLVPLPFRVLSAQEARRFLLEAMTVEQKEMLARDQQVDFMYELPGVSRFRANVFVQNQGLGAVFRIIPGRVPTLEELMLPSAIKKLTGLSNGLVLVTGPTGAGKTTSLAAMVHEINLSSQRHIITIEDPVEFVHEPIKGVITQREVGTHVESFAAGLRSGLRETPDVIVLGEMRDSETAQLALSAAETGVLVFGTLHTNSAAKAVDRIIDVIPEDVREQARSVLSVVLRGVVAQHLCKKASGEGRVAAAEVLLQSHAISHLIRENKIHQIETYLQSDAEDGAGMQSLDRSLLRLVREGMVSAEEAVKYANYPETFRRQASLLVALNEDA